VEEVKYASIPDKKVHAVSVVDIGYARTTVVKKDAVNVEEIKSVSTA
jgi:hypothetical protein